MTIHYMPVLRRMRAVLIFITILWCQSCWNGFNSAMDGMWSGFDAPDEVVFVDSLISSGTLTLKYTVPTDARFDHTEVSWTGSSTGSLIVPKTASQCDITGLSPTPTALGSASPSAIKEYNITVRSADVMGNRSAGTSFRFIYRSGDAAVKFIYGAADFDAIPWTTVTNNYVLMTDIERNSYPGWTPVDFTGTLNGNNHVIRNLNVTVSNDLAGFFKTLTTSVVGNLGLENVDVHLNAVSTDCIAGSLTASNDRSVIYNCHAAGSVALVANGVNVKQSIGGIVGENYGLIYRCYTAVSVTGTHNASSGDLDIGGITGYQFDDVNCLVSNCYSSGPVTGTVQNNTVNIGGLVGHLERGAIDNSYATSAVVPATTGTGTIHKGGLVGYKTSSLAVTSSYYDSTTTGQSDTGKGDGKTTAEMKTRSTFGGWDFSGVWSIDASVNNGYPYFTGMLP